MKPIEKDGDFLVEPERHTPVIEEVDVLVAGGGPAGIAAAVTAARQGHKVALLEKYGFLGGMATAGMVATICGLYYRNQGEIQHIIRGFAEEFVTSLQEIGGCRGPFPFRETAATLYVPWAFKLVADSMVAREKNISLHLHTQAVDLAPEGRSVAAVLLQNKSGRQAVRTRTVIDCTGDADLARVAGVPCETGKMGKVQVPTMMFVMQNVDLEKVLKFGHDRVDELIDQHGRKGEFKLSSPSGSIYPTFRKGEVIVKMSQITKDGRAVDASDAEELTYAEIEGRRQALEASEFLVRHMPGFGEAFLSDSAPQVGIRETTRIVGEYVLTDEDVLGGRRFDDAIACSAWPVEVHAEGERPGFVFLKEGEFYQIPYRCLLPQGVDNLLVAGRCISATHQALASARVMAVCMAEGQAAGLAAGIAVEGKTAVTDVDVEVLQRKLRETGARLD